MSMLKPALQGVDRGRAKLKLRVVDVKALPSRDSIAFVSQRASPATYAWVKVDGVQNYESRLADLDSRLPVTRSFEPRSLRCRRSSARPQSRGL